MRRATTGAKRRARVAFPGLATVHHALVTDAQIETYRGHGGGELVAWVPKGTRPSWRLVLLPAMIAAALWRWW